MSNLFALVIEDDLDASDIFSKALEAAGCKTEIIDKGDKALQRIQECNPTLIVLDLHLPNVDGTIILTEMRKDPRFARTIVMLATADPRMAETVKDMADLVLLKPVTFTQVRDFAIRLLRRVEMAASQAQMSDESATPAAPASTSETPSVIEATSADGASARPETVPAPAVPSSTVPAALPVPVAPASASETPSIVEATSTDGASAKPETVPAPAVPLSTVPAAPPPPPAAPPVPSAAPAAPPAPPTDPVNTLN
jgi:CheY-like chemotaxis protein